MQAVIKHAKVPAISARTAKLAKSGRLVGASALRPPIWTPSEPILAKPHRAYVAMISERSYDKGWNVKMPAKKRGKYEKYERK